MPGSDWGVLIADDEPAARRGVRQLLARFPEFAVVGECRDGAEVLASLDVLRPHVVFLDVQMPGIDGFEVIRRRTPERMPAVVFLTAYDQFAIRAFEAQALDYLVKPVTEARFAATMKRLARQLRGSAPPAREPALVVTTARGATVLPLREIDWIEAADNYARIWTGGRSYLLREPLRILEQRVQPHGFRRAHRRALVRLSAVRTLTWTEADDLIAVLASGARIPISRRRRAAFAAAVRSI
ncbi:MAG TPA: LytTR family DNA-binding domain-containing protein [Vicinamibacterales bacterium]|nr:LytTR family DNA-binding domain-containing protein [Vicinamibacterales bacterium]